MSKLIKVTNERALKSMLEYMQLKLERQEELDPFKDNSPYINTCKEILSQLWENANFT